MIKKFLIGLEDVNEKQKSLLMSKIDSETALFSCTKAAAPYIPKNSEIEVYGAWEDMCITGMVARALKVKTHISVPKKFIVKSNKKELSLPEAVKNFYQNNYTFNENAIYYHFSPR